jgi:hypothetical protein
MIRKSGYRFSEEIMLKQKILPSVTGAAMAPMTEGPPTGVA